MAEAQDIIEVSSRRRAVGMVLGAIAFLGVLAAPPFTPAPEAQRVAAVTLLMAIWWISEAAPLSTTALLPLVLLPALGVSSISEAAAPFADPVIFLFLGGFILAAAMERSNLHRRAGLACVGAIGTTPRRLLAAFLVTTAGLSMWVSNTATAAMMLPVATAVIALVESQGAEPDARDHRNLGAGILLAVAYGANIGGLATLIGSPPNALLAGYMSRAFEMDIGFGRWMLVGVPVSGILLVIAWGVLARLHPVRITLPDSDAALRAARASLGRMSKAEWRVAAVFLLTAAAWITRPLFQTWFPDLSDAGIAVTAALVLFIVPSGRSKGGRLVEAADLKRVPWDVLLLFGGGLSLAAAISGSGLADYVGQVLQGAQVLPLSLVVLLLTACMIVITELTSNTASAATFLPIGGALALAMSAAPLTLALPLALAASCSFMLPVGTPPNAVVYGSGRVRSQDMLRAGLWLNLAATGVIAAAALGLAPWVFAP